MRKSWSEQSPLSHNQERRKWRRKGKTVLLAAGSFSALGCGRAPQIQSLTRARPIAHALPFSLTHSNSVTYSQLNSHSHPLTHSNTPTVTHSCVHTHTLPLTLIQTYARLRQVVPNRSCHPGCLPGQLSRTPRACLSHLRCHKFTLNK